VKKGVGTAATADSGEVNQVFGTALAAQPIPPAHFRLYFPSDATTLAPTSDEEYPLVFKDIKRRTVYEVEIVGHTDTMGPLAYNQELSLKRAKAIKKRLVRDGLDPNSISVAGRGQLDLAVKTGSRVSEAKNRRVEITVR
jgi:outer membrane protein OmpA-like peptidoglycan-associated protein